MEPQADSHTRILVVDDDPAVRHSLDRILRRVGYDLVTAESAERALELLQLTDISLILTDLRMPGLGGHGLVRVAENLVPRIPIVVMSGDSDMEDVIECLRHGVADYVVKPWKGSELPAVLDRVLHRPPLMAASHSATATPSSGTRNVPVPYAPARVSASGVAKAGHPDSTGDKG